MTTWMIEGEWSGPQNPAGNWTRIVHREFTKSRNRADACRNLHSILYSDGTRLFLTVTERHRSGQRPPAIPGYHELINACLQTGIASVDDLDKSGALR